MTSQRPLTPKQQSVLEFVKARNLAKVPPTLKDIAAFVGGNIANPAAGNCHIQALIEKGYITRDKHSRTIRIVGQVRPEEIVMPDLLLACCGKQIGSQIVWQVDQWIVLSYGPGNDWTIGSRPIPDELCPRNMGEVWQLLARLGIDRRKK